MRNDLEFIVTIAEKEREHDMKLRSNGARTLKRIADRARKISNNYDNMIRLIDRVASLNKNAGEIGAGMLNQLVDEAEEIKRNLENDA